MPTQTPKKTIAAGRPAAAVPVLPDTDLCSCGVLLLLAVRDGLLRYEDCPAWRWPEPEHTRQHVTDRQHWQREAA